LETVFTQVIKVKWSNPTDYVLMKEIRTQTHRGTTK
jgi:hypothetical protein